MNVLVAYASKNGSTAEIAEAIAAEIRRAGLEADCVSADQVESLGMYDAVVLGSAVYMKHWQKSARKLLSRRSTELAARPLWVFSSGPCGQAPDPSKQSWAEPPKIVRRVEQLGARAHVVFGGRVPIEPHNFIERSMANDTPEEFRDLRDWDEIKAWAAGIAAELHEERNAMSALRAV